MSDSHVNVGQIECELSNLTVFTANAKSKFPETVLREHQPFSLKVTVDFSGPGAIALMPLAPMIYVEFHAKPLSPEPAMVLGHIAAKAIPGVWTYTPTLNLGSPRSMGLRPKTIYRIAAVLRVGAPEGPSLINGFTEELTIEIYTVPETSNEPVSHRVILHPDKEV